MPIQVVRDFCAAWEARDQARILDAFTDDGVYHNIPMQPAEGKDAIKGLLAMILGQATEVTFEIVNMVASGDVVMTERVDTFRMGERTIALPVMGVFEVRDGKIAAWRDYFDLATWTNRRPADDGRRQRRAAEPAIEAAPLPEARDQRPTPTSTPSSREGLVAHVGFEQAGQPFVLPMVYLYREGRLFLHGSKASRAA